MDDQSVRRESVAEGGVPAVRERPLPSPARRGFGLSWRLFLLSVLFVTVSEVLIYIPSVANFRISWLADRLTLADAASTVIADQAETGVPRDIQNDLLTAVGAIAIAVRTGTVSRLIATVEMPPQIDDVVDLRVMDPVAEIGDAFSVLTTPTKRILRVIGRAKSGATLELVIDDRQLRTAMLRYSINIVWLSLAISIITGAFLYFSINRLLVRPMRRLTENMVSFSTAPDDGSRIIAPSGRRDEIGVAEEHLAAMQEALQGTLARTAPPRRSWPRRFQDQPRPAQHARRRAAFFRSPVEHPGRERTALHAAAHRRAGPRHRLLPVDARLRSRP